mgnify:CR=1 FL=1
MRLIAILIIMIPGLIATFGVKLMRDALFDVFHPIFLHTVVQFIIGLIFFIGGLGFIAGFILHRDKKRKNIK